MADPIQPVRDAAGAAQAASVSTSMRLRELAPIIRFNPSNLYSKVRPYVPTVANAAPSGEPTPGGFHTPPALRQVHLPSIPGQVTDHGTLLPGVITKDISHAAV